MLQFMIVPIVSVFILILIALSAQGKGKKVPTKNALSSFDDA